jgi:23S rRNA (uracil1939-C5)-methyltransferase
MQVKALEIVDIGGSGEGIARLENGEAAFIPYAVTGDKVDVFLQKEKGVWRGRIETIVTSSAHRTTPPCRHFGRCGGCALQHVSDPFYRSYKKDHIVKLFLKNGLKLPDNTLEIHIPHATRRRANFASIVAGNRTIIGFHERKSGNIRDVPDCLLLREDIRLVMEGFRKYLPAIAGTGNKLDLLIQSIDGEIEAGLTGKLLPSLAAQEALGDALCALNLARISFRERDYEYYKVLLEKKSCFKNFGKIKVKLAPGVFLQPSEEGEAALVECVIREAGETSRAADLFCGNGTFTGHLLDGREVAAFDSASDATAALKQAGVKAVERNLFKAPLTPEELKGFDLVVMDPPRAGAMEQSRMLAESTVPKIVYVSCNPQSFARDAVLLQNAGYKISALTIIDQFIWSPHTEVVVALVR